MTDLHLLPAAENYAIEINRLHQRLELMMCESMTEAIQLGKLLLEVKGALKHGEFGAWVGANLKPSVRQCQRYMALAQGKPVPLRLISGKSDTVSHLDSPKQDRAVVPSEGLWKDDIWMPERGCTYLFKEDGGTYWITPSPNGAFHVCKHYSGERQTADGFYWRYTILSAVHDPDLNSELYIGTRSPILSQRGVHGVLATYGLKNARAALVFGFKDENPSERPFGEPDPEYWYWDSTEPDDELFQAVKRMGLLNAQGVPVHLSS